MIDICLQLVKLNRLMEVNRGDRALKIGIVDGPVEFSHIGLAGVSFQVINTAAGCLKDNSAACLHGTFATGMLAAQRGSSAAAICPDCTFIVRPVFCELPSADQSCPETTPEELAQAVIETVNAGARVINLSMGLSNSALLDYQELKEAFDYACLRGVIIVGAAGNQGRIGPVPLFTHPWVIPVVACDQTGRLYARSNLGPSIGRRGLMAPGVNISSACSTGGYMTMTGTSVAVPFVTGAIALLWTSFPDLSACEIRNAILLPDAARKSVVPPLLDAERSWRALAGNAAARRPA